MDNRKVMQQVLDAWDNPMGMKDMCVAMDAIRTALEQQQAEPVTCGYDETTGNCTRNPCCHPTPPQRQWVGLTHAQAKECVQAWDENDAYALCRAIEAKLKEKNS